MTSEHSFSGHQQPLMNINYCFTLKDVILYHENKSKKDLEFIVKLFHVTSKN